MELLSNDNKLLNSFFKDYLFGTVISVVFTILVIILNGIIIGNFFGNIGLAAYGLTMPILYANLAIGYVFAYGGSIVASNNMADAKRVNNNFSVVCIVAAIVGITLTVLLLFFSSDVAHILGASGESFNATVSLMRGLFLVILPLIFLYIFINYSRIDGYPQLGLYAGIILFPIKFSFRFGIHFNIENRYLRCRTGNCIKHCNYSIIPVETFDFKEKLI